MTAMDEVDGRLGQFTAVPATQGFRHGWSARRVPFASYTTRITEVPSVRA
jgi:DNA polymerase V